MAPRPERTRRVAVIGGGISGLAAANRLRELDPEVELSLLEAGERLGGVLYTERRDGYLLEHSADNFITSTPDALELCRRIGLGDELVGTNEALRRAFVVRKGKLVPVPPGFQLMAPARVWPFLKTPLLSPWGKLRVAAEYFVPRRKDPSEESLASFARRRFGREAFERLIQPLVGGIYTADAEKLSVEAVLKRFVDMERQHGSVIRALRRRAAAQRARDGGASGARYGLFVALRDGMGSLVEALAARLPEGAVRTGTPVERVERTGDGRWRCVLSGEADTGPAAEEFDAVVVTVPARKAAELVRGIDRALAEDLGGIAYAGASIALAGYRREQIEHALDGFGFVVPKIEHRRILAGSFSSNKYPGRAPEGSVLIRVFVGGAMDPELADLPDDKLAELVQEELADLLGVKGPPELFEIARWKSVMPQYHLGHVERVRRIDERAAKWAGLELAGNAYHGVGVPDCVRTAEAASERILGEAASEAARGSERAGSSRE